jgi:hypothetical protein
MLYDRIGGTPLHWYTIPTLEYVLLSGAARFVDFCYPLPSF